MAAESVFVVLVQEESFGGQHTALIRVIIHVLIP